MIGKRISIGNDCLIANEVIIFDAPGIQSVGPLRLRARRPDERQ